MWWGRDGVGVVKKEYSEDISFGDDDDDDDDDEDDDDDGNNGVGKTPGVGVVDMGECDLVATRIGDMRGEGGGGTTVPVPTPAPGVGRTGGGGGDTDGEML